MAEERSGEKVYVIDSFGKMQVKTSRFLREKTDISLAQNAHYEEIGSIGKKLGYAQRASDLTSTTSTSTSSTTTTSTSSSTSTTTTSTSTTL